jgi:hypothetical protein
LDLKRPNPASVAKYKAFHGRNPREFKRFGPSLPQEWIFLARAEGLQYISNKLNGGGTGRTEAFTHRFGAQIRVFTDPTGSFLLISGPGLRVTSRGIVG